MQDLKPIIAANIAELRRYLKLTQSELAVKLNYSDKAVSKWERGESLPDIIILKQLADMCDVPLDYLVKNHSGEKKLQPKNPNRARNRIIITLLSIVALWLLATVAVVIVSSVVRSFEYQWIIYIGTAIASEIVLLVFNSIWGIGKLNYIIITVLLWSMLTAFYFIFSPGYTLVFLIGIPSQIIIVLWSFLNMKIKTH